MFGNLFAFLVFQFVHYILLLPRILLILTGVVMWSYRLSTEPGSARLEARMYFEEVFLAHLPWL